MTVLNDTTVHHIPLAQLTPAADNPRSDLGDLDGPRQSIDENGVIGPLIVTPVPGESDLDNDDDTTNATRARWVALGYQLQPWEQATDDADGIDAEAGAA